MGIEKLQDGLIKERNMVTIPVQPEFLLSLLQIPAEGVRVGNSMTLPGANSIPDGCNIVGAGINENGCFTLILEHPTFNPVAPGARIPERIPEYTVLPIKNDDHE